MLSFKQCELARTMTKTTTSDTQINDEFKSINLTSKICASEKLDELLQLHNKPFDLGFNIMTEDFSAVAKEYGISPATLFCIYMESKQPSLDDKLKKAKMRSDETLNVNKTQVNSDGLDKGIEK